MTDPNEEIVRQYLEMRGYFVRTNVAYKRRKEETGKASSGWGDLDLLAWHPNGTRLLVEVKGWHTEDVTPSYFDVKEPYIDVLMRRAAANIFGTADFKAVLIVSSVGPQSMEAVKDRARKQGIDQLWTFSQILSALVKGVKINENQRSEVLQMTRLFKVFHFVE